MKALSPFLTAILLVLVIAPVFAEGLSTNISSVHSGQFPVINTQLKIFCKEPIALTKENFTLSEDGKKVKDFAVTIDKPKQYYILTIDRSSSIKQDMPTVKQAVYEFLKSINPEVSIGVISFASDVQLEHEFSTDRKSIYKAVMKIRAWGGTTLYDSIYEAVERLKRVAKRGDQKTIVCLADGVDSNPRGTGPMSVKSLKEVAQHASENSTRVISIGLGREIDERALKNLATKTNGAYLRAPTAEQLKGAYRAISKRAKLERYYAVEHTSPNPERDGKVRQLQIASLHNGKKGQGTGSYRAPTTPPPETKQEISLRTQDLGIENRLLGIEPRLLGIEGRVLEEGTPRGFHWFGSKEEGERIHVTGDGFYSETYQGGLPNGPYGQWKRDGTPTGFHGNKFNGRDQGERIHISGDSFYVETYENGVASGSFGQWKLDGTPTGFHGNKIDGRKQGERIHISGDRFFVETYENDRASGYYGQWKLDGTPTGFHGNKFNGRDQGKRIHISGDSFYVETYEAGVASGAYGQWNKDGTATGFHGNRADGKDQGVRVHITADSLYVNTYEDGVASGAYGQWKMDGTAKGVHGNKVGGKDDGERIYVPSN